MRKSIQFRQLAFRITRAIALTIDNVTTAKWAQWAILIGLVIVLTLVTVYFQSSSPAVDSGQSSSQTSSWIPPFIVGVLTATAGVVGNILAQRYLDWEKRAVPVIKQLLSSDNTPELIGRAIGATLRLAAIEASKNSHEDEFILRKLASTAESAWDKVTRQYPNSSELWLADLTDTKVVKFLRRPDAALIKHEQAEQLLRILNEGKTPSFNNAATHDLAVHTIIDKFSRSLEISIQQDPYSFSRLWPNIHEQLFQSIFKELESLRTHVQVNEFNEKTHLVDNQNINQGENLTNKSIKSATIQAAYPLLLETVPAISENEISWLQNIFEREIGSMVSEWNFIFSRIQYQQKIRDIADDAVLAELFTGWSSDFMKVQTELSSTARHGLGNLKEAVAYINKAGGFRVTVSPAHVSTLAIFSTLQHEFGLSITVDFRRAHSIEILKQAKQEVFDTDAFTLTIATTGALVTDKSSKHHVPFMLMPGMTHGIIGSAINQIQNLPLDGEYYLMKETASTELLVLRDIMKLTDPHNISIVEAEPNDSTEALSSGDAKVRSIIGFPHYEFNIKYNLCILLPFSKSNPTPSKPIILFISIEKLKDARYMEYLQLLIRDVWLRFIQSPVIMQRAAKRLANNPDYVSVLYRITGVATLKRKSSFLKTENSNPLKTGTQGAMLCRHAKLNEIIMLRHHVLRPSLSCDESILPQDYDSMTRHYGIFDENGKANACMSLMPSEWDGCNAWQLRAMAVAENQRRLGIGSNLIRYTFEDLEFGAEALPIWCNARVLATGFYSKFGWKIASDEFDGFTAGQLVKMVLFPPYPTGANDEYHRAIS